MTPDSNSGSAPPIELLLESSLESVDRAEELAVEFAAKHGIDEDGTHQLGMAVRESMVNAVVHGNRYSERKRVHFGLRATADRVVITIGDEGESFFDASKLPDPLAEENLLKQSGRGILLMRAFVDEFEMYPRQPSGTEVRMTKYINQPEAGAAQ